MNKTQLIDALAARYEGDRRAAANALESVLDTITREIAKGEKVAITGFGSFEKKVREARWVRNPSSGKRMRAREKAVPSFKPGAQLKDVVSGAKKLPKLTLSVVEKTTAASQPVLKTAAASAAAVAGTSKSKKSTTKTSTAKSTPAKKASRAKKTSAKKSSSTTKSSAAKSAPGKKTSTAKKSLPSATTKKSASKSSSAKKAAPATTSAPAAKKAPKKEPMPASAPTRPRKRPNPGYGRG